MLQLKLMAASMCLKLLAKTLDAWITIVKIAAPMIWLTSFGCSMRLTIMLNGAKKIESPPYPFYTTLHVVFHAGTKDNLSQLWLLT